MSVAEFGPRRISSDRKRETANRLLRQRVIHAPLGAYPADADAIPEAHYRLDLHPAYLDFDCLGQTMAL